MRTKVVSRVAIAVVCAAFAATAANAGYVTVDLSPYVNEGFTNSWFINGSEFSPIIGTTMGNQGSPVPFNVANPSDGNGGNNNFWFGLYSGPGTLFGPPGSVTIPISTPGVVAFYTLADNTFGIAGNIEFNVTVNGSGGPLTGDYIGGSNTQDYNSNCSTTGCGVLSNAWFIDTDATQWLGSTLWILPAGYNLTSITFNQVDLSDGAILAGLTLVTPSVPEPLTLSLFGAGLAGATVLRRRKRRA